MLLKKTHAHVCMCMSLSVQILLDFSGNVLHFNSTNKEQLMTGVRDKI